MATDGAVSAAAASRSDALTAVMLRRVPAVSVAAAIFWIAFDGGSYALPSWTKLGIAASWVVALGVVLRLWVVRSPGRDALAVAALATAFAAWIGLSSLWAADAEGAVTACGRALVYVGVLALVLVASSRRTMRDWSDGVTAGIAAIALLALASRCFPQAFPTDKALAFIPDAHTRLSYPVDYWNGLAILVALAAPQLLRFAVSERPPAVRAAALALFPVVATDVYLASSRSGALSAAVGVSVFVALAARRWHAAAAAATAIAGSVVAVAGVAHEHQLVNGPLETSTAHRQGAVAAAIVVAVGVVTALVWRALDRRVAVLVPPRRARTVVLVAAAFVVIAGLVAVDPVTRWRSFTQPPSVLAQQGYIQNHFLSTNGNWRWQYWRSAVDEFRAKPLAGGGAGSYEAWWSQRGRLVGFIGNAHSLYFETLGELGLIGLLLIGAAVVGGIDVGARRAFRLPRPYRDVAAAATAAFAGYATGAGVDWMWELPAISVAGFAFLGLAIGPGTAGTARVGARRARNWARVAVVAAAVVVALAEADLLLADSEIQASQRSVARGDFPAARSEANTAHDLTPWAATPHLQRALVDEAAGNLHDARRAIDGAIAKDRSDWRVWLIAARIDVKAGDIPAARQALAQAKSLNPRSNVFASLDQTTK